MIGETDREKYYFGALVAWGLFFSIAYSFFLQNTSPPSGDRIFNSPDENANYIFTQLFTEKNSYVIPEPLNEKYGNVLYPRSMRVEESGGLMPGSFFGMMAIYGILAKFFGEWIIVLLTPIISFFGALYFFKFLKEIFLKKLAFASALLLFIFPGWWYYNSRSMFHNALFVNLLIFFLYSFLKFLRSQNTYRLIASMIFLGLSMAVRFSEIVWILPGFCIALFLARKRVSWKAIMIIIVFFSLSFFGIAYYNNKIFGNAFTAGYSMGSQSSIFSMIFPFGFHPKRAFVNFYNYFINIFWWYGTPIILGLLGVFRKYKRLTDEQKYYTVIFCLLSLFLIFYYGSWSISDNLDPEKVTIGTSYIRYWLPIYVFSIPFAAYFFQKILSYFKQKGHKFILASIFTATLAYFSYYLVWIKTEESLVSVQERIKEYYIKRDAVSEIIPEDAIIMTERSDKIFFPKFNVITEPRKDAVLIQVKNMLADNLPVFYYTFLSDKDVYEYEKHMNIFGLGLDNKIKIFGNEYLYQVKSTR